MVAAAAVNGTMTTTMTTPMTTTTTTTAAAAATTKTMTTAATGARHQPVRDRAVLYAAGRRVEQDFRGGRETGADIPVLR
jgi:hypothetical protein